MGFEISERHTKDITRRCQMTVKTNFQRDNPFSRKMGDFCQQSISNNFLLCGKREEKVIRIRFAITPQRKGKAFGYSSSYERLQVLPHQGKGLKNSARSPSAQYTAINMRRIKDTIKKIQEQGVTAIQMIAKERKTFLSTPFLLSK